ncbi:hypothetical protein CDAR_383441 [Caerostris darwini]|uniref:Uncharacterized protein n=1 Tax=Caerostris darwini TaxID=1538125 RepID=A0AAV4NVI4_9ARAC|nr:hypothetical protein CDAR_383441 [Caerostris darwini]
MNKNKILRISTGGQFSRFSIHSGGRISSKEFRDWAFMSCTGGGSASRPMFNLMRLQEPGHLIARVCLSGEKDPVGVYAVIIDWRKNSSGMDIAWLIQICWVLFLVLDSVWSLVLMRFPVVQMWKRISAKVES